MWNGMSRMSLSCAKIDEPEARLTTAMFELPEHSDDSGTPATVRLTPASMNWSGAYVVPVVSPAGDLAPQVTPPTVPTFVAANTLPSAMLAVVSRSTQSPGDECTQK